MPHTMLSCVYWFNSRSARKSKSRQLASSEPVPMALPLGKNWTELISDSCPANVWTHRLARISQTLAVASQAPETKMFGFGLKDKLKSQHTLDQMGHFLKWIINGIYFTSLRRRCDRWILRSLLQHRYPRAYKSYLQNWSISVCRWWTGSNSGSQCVRKVL